MGSVIVQVFVVFIQMFVVVKDVIFEIVCELFVVVWVVGELFQLSGVLVDFLVLVLVWQNVVFVVFGQYGFVVQDVLCIVVVECWLNVFELIDGFEEFVIWVVIIVEFGVDIEGEFFGFLWVIVVNLEFEFVFGSWFGGEDVKVVLVECFFVDVFVIVLMVFIVMFFVCQLCECWVWQLLSWVMCIVLSQCGCFVVMVYMVIEFSDVQCM